MGRHWRLALLAAIVAGISLVQTLRLARDVRPYYYPGWEDEVTRAERTFEPIRTRLAGRRYVGYATDVPNGALMGLGYADQTWRYFLAQFALAPAIVSRKPGVLPVVADFATPARFDAFVIAHGHRVVWRHGGLGLLEGPSR